MILLFSEQIIRQVKTRIELELERCREIAIAKTPDTGFEGIHIPEHCKDVVFYNTFITPLYAHTARISWW